MRALVRWGTIAIAVVAVAAAVTTYWLFYDNRLPRDGSFPLSLTALRAEAARLPGSGPTRIEVEELSHTFVPEIAMVAGTGWGKIDLVRASYRLVWPDRTAMIDTGNSLRLARRFGAATYDVSAWQRMQQALESADPIVVTHGHADHIGGLIEGPHLAAILPRTLLNPEQASGHESEPLDWPKAQFAHYRPLSYRGIRAIAPGVVLIRAPGHTPGSQMVYVRRADGREFIFMGDTASSLANVTTRHIRSRYVTNYYGTHQDDRRAVMLQTMALHRLAAEAPDVVLVPGHDAMTIRGLERRGLLIRAFHLPR